MQSNQLRHPFALGFADSLKNPVLRKVAGVVERSAEHIFALEALGAGYRELKEKAVNDKPFPRQILELLNTGYELTENCLERIPESGPAVVVANHPFGGIEGVILADLLSRRRSDVRIMANFLLKRIPELSRYFIFVDPFGATSAATRNLKPLRDAIAHVRSGGLLAIFPSGTVSHFQWGRREVTDPVWSPTIARLIRHSGASVTPLFIHGRNGNAFQAAGAIHPLLRTALLPREFWNKRGSTISLRIGTPIAAEKTARLSDDRELMQYLRLRTYLLGSDAPGALRESSSPFRRKKKSQRRKLKPLGTAIDPEVLAADITALEPEQILGESGDYVVAYATAREAPNIMQEIGRLREATFRAVQEGTGNSLDLDHFDSYYTHLFVWNRKKFEIVGAYRLVKTDHVLRTHGLNGLYTSTLFAYRSELLEQIGPSLELGRSFVREEYQKNYNSLNLLWKGIGTYVSKNPDYPILFGTVSISNEYDSLSRQLIASFLKANNYLPELARQIRARNPMPKATLRGIDVETSSIVVKDVNEVSELIADIETSERRVPILLKQYLKLGGRLLGFNIDPDFGNVLDGLIYVDLRETDARLLDRYMGKDGARLFREHHSISYRPLRAVPSENKTSPEE